MPLTAISVQGKFTNADGSPASGVMCATPNSQVTNLVGGVANLSRAPICGLVDGQGRLAGQNYLAFVAYALDDEGTTPVGSSYSWGLALDGQLVVTFEAPLLKGGETDVPLDESTSCFDAAAVFTESSEVVTLGDLLASPTMIGAAVAGALVPGGTHVTAYDAGANTLTLSAAASAGGSDPTFAVGGCVDFFYLRRNAL